MEKSIDSSILDKIKIHSCSFTLQKDMRSEWYLTQGERDDHSPNKNDSGNSRNNCLVGKTNQLEQILVQCREHACTVLYEIGKRIAESQREVWWRLEERIAPSTYSSKNELNNTVPCLWSTSQYQPYMYSTVLYDSSQHKSAQLVTINLAVQNGTHHSYACWRDPHIDMILKMRMWKKYEWANQRSK